VDDGEAAALAEAPPAVGVPLAEAAAAVGLVLAVAVLPEATAPALARAWASAAFLADTADMLETKSDAARAAPTINVMMGVAIFMLRGTQRRPLWVQRFRRT
jgi:hypothetical protein